MMRLLSWLSLLLAVATPLRAEVLRLDYAYYNPVSLVLKANHWVEDAVGPGVQVEWVQSAGSNTFVTSAVYSMLP